MAEAIFALIPYWRAVLPRKINAATILTSRQYLIARANSDIITSNLAFLIIKIFNKNHAEN